jgi:betaine-aldehyde dehydrogenase
VAELCGTRLARVNLELGGKSPAIVLPDADLDTVAAQMLAGCFIGSGQACNALTRLIVPESRHDEVVGAVLEQLDSIRMGDPFDPATTHGPLISARQRERVERYVQSGHDEGARLLAGGGRPEGLPDGWFFEPTVFDDVTSEMTVAREEIFGPVLSVLRYSGDEREAVRIANDSDYGLHGAVFTTDLDRGLAVAGQVRSGTFSINCYRTNMYVPYGGMKSSGIGRKFDTVGLEAYTEIKTVNLP